MPQTTDSPSTTSDEAAEQKQTAAGSTPNGAETDAPVDSVVPVTTHLDQEASIPFVGLTPDTGSDHPDPVSPVGDCFDATDPGQADRR